MGYFTAPGGAGQADGEQGRKLVAERRGEETAVQRLGEYLRLADGSNPAPGRGSGT